MPCGGFFVCLKSKKEIVSRTEVAEHRIFFSAGKDRYGRSRLHRKAALLTGFPKSLTTFRKRRISEMSDKSDSLQRFIDKVQRVTQLTELTPEIVREFIEKIVVSKPKYRDGKRYQNLEIYYNGVGIVREPTPEEMEELFQEHLRNRKSEKTA
jgi:hypothetical protein